MQKPELRSPLSLARGLGSAKEGTGHFIMQRVTAIVLVPTTIWFVFSILSLALSADLAKTAHWFASGFNAITTILMLAALFYHAKLGVQVIIEDYIHCPCIKIASLLANYFVMFALAAVSIVAVLKLHLHLIA
jgi:succinate dehydrogenase / fumarate reductase membrane anchor subunit